MTKKSAPKVIFKKSAYEKVFQKFQKSGGGGQTFLEEFQNTAAFFLWEAPLVTPVTVFRAELFTFHC